MAVDKKISQLTSLAQVDVSASTDVLPIVDTSAVETKKITVSALVGAGATAGISGAVLTNGTINSTTIGATTPSTGAFTTLSASGAVSLNPANANVSLAPTGTGVVTINPATAGTMNNVAIGGSTAAAGTFTSATVSTGNLTFSSTAQRITGDFSNATLANRLAFQTSTTNGLTGIYAIPNGTAQTAIWGTYNSSDTANCSGFDLTVTPSEARLRNFIAGTGTYLPMTFYTGGSERMRLDTSGNLLVGTATSVGGVRLTSVGGGVQLSGGTTAQEGVRIQRATGYATFTGINNDNNAYNGLQFFTSASAAVTIDTSGNVGIGATPSYRLDVQGGTASFTGSSGANAIRVAGAGGSWFWIDNPTTTTMRFSSGATAGTGAMVLDSSGNVGIGATPSYTLDVNTASATFRVRDASGGNDFGIKSVAGPVSLAGSRANTAIGFMTNDTERMRVDTSGNVGIGGTADAYAKTQIKGNLPASGGTSVSYDTQAVITSSATSSAIMYESFPSVQNASFTLPILYHFIAAQGTKGASATVTNQYGFFAGSSLTGATNNYGFYSDIASGSNRWNFYAAGTAQNYFAGDTGVGATPAANYRFWVKGSDSTSSNAAVGVVNSSNTNMFYLRNDNYFNSGAINNYSVAGTTVVIDSNNFLGKTTSSLRYKKDIVNYDKGLLAISKLRPVYYKSAVEGPNGLDPKQHAGLIAEEIEAEGFEEFLIRDNDGRAESIQYPNMVALLVKAVQELKAELEALKAA